MKKWFIKLDGKQHGPFVIENLAKLKTQGKLDKTTPIWCKIGTKFEWINAGDVTPLQDLFHKIKASDVELDGIFEQGGTATGASLGEARDKVWAFASGKGGVGKTLMTSAFAIILAQMGKKVVVVDLDLGGSNMHTIFWASPT